MLTLTYNYIAPLALDQNSFGCLNLFNIELSVHFNVFILLRNERVPRP